MADTLIAGTTLIEKESRSIGDVPIGGIVEWDDTFGNLPDGYVLADGSTVNDPLSAWNGTAAPDLNTNYWSVGGNGFTTTEPDIDDITQDSGTGELTLNGASLVAKAPIYLPNGATVTAVVVYSNVSTEDFLFQSALIADNSDFIIHAQSALNTPDITITSGVIDNSTRKYMLRTESMDTTDVINGALITYTPRNKFIMRVR